MQPDSATGANTRTIKSKRTCTAANRTAKKSPTPRIKGKGYKSPLVAHIETAQDMQNMLKFILQDLLVFNELNIIYVNLIQQLI